MMIHAIEDVAWIVPDISAESVALSRLDLNFIFYMFKSREWLV